MDAGISNIECRSCGAPLPLSGGTGCPACLLRAALGDDAGKGKGPARTVPSLEKLAPLFPAMEFKEMIGRGGMGVVYQAQQKTLERMVAVKILLSGDAENPEFGERFLREAQALAGLSHPNIVALHDFGRTVRGHWYFVMEYVEGCDLARMIQGGKLTPAAALALVPQICDALACAHEAGFIHRDIKPANILVDPRGRVKVADFGLAKLTGTRRQDVTLTSEGTVMGTPRYMAPEQLERPMEVDHRADIYALGVVFYEMLTGQVPQGNFQPPSAFTGGDPRLDEVVLKAMERDPSRRFQQVSEIKQDLARAVRPRGKWHRWRWPLLAASVVVASIVLWRSWPEPAFSRGPVFRENSLGQKFAPVPGTEVSFCLWETRVRDWAVFCQDTGRGVAEAVFAQDPSHPVVSVHQGEIDAFCEWLTARDRRLGKLAGEEFYRLPTDAEWSAAAGLTPETGAVPEEKHIGRPGVYPWGDRAPAPQGVGNYADAALRAVQDGALVIPAYYDGYARTAPVGSFPPNANGLFDVGGNVWEWTGTPFSEKRKAPVLRGGSWRPLEGDETWSALLSSYRRSDLGAEGGAADCGFRVVIARREGGPQTRDLFSACREDRVDELEALLKAGASPLENDPDHRTPLMVAARHGALPCLRALRERNSPLEAEDRAGNTALVHAIQSRQSEAALWLLEKGADASHRNAGSQTPLMAAAREGLTAVMEKLIAAGAEVDAATGFGSTALTEAVDGGQKAAMECLIRHKASLKRSSKNMAGPLHFAANLGNTEMARLLLDAGADLEDGDSQMMKPLGFAALGGNPAMVGFLLSRGAQADLKSLRLAVFSAIPSNVDALLKKLDPPMADLLEAGVLEAAAMNAGARMASLMGGLSESIGGHWMYHRFLDRLNLREGRDQRAVVRRLLARGLPADHPKPGTMTALSHAAQGGLIAVMEELLDHGAELDRADQEGFSPLQSAAERGQAEAVRLLLERGAWVEAVTKEQRTALHLASCQGSVETLGMLLAKGARLEARDKDGLTPLLHACLEGRVEVVRALLQAGASLEAASTGPAPMAAGLKALHMAALGRKMMETSLEEARRQNLRDMKPMGRPGGSEKEYTAVLNLLLDHGADPNASLTGGFSPLMCAARSDNQPAVKLLLEKGARTGMVTAQGMTALDFAAQAGAIGSLKLLLEAGSKPDPWPGQPMQTPLHFAAQGGSAEAIGILLQAGADLKALDPRRATALHWAVNSGKAESVKTLMAAGADPEARDLAHSTPLHLAAYRGDLDIVRLLLRHGAKPFTRNLESATPADLARHAGHAEAATLIENEIARRSPAPAK